MLGITITINNDDICVINQSIFTLVYRSTQIHMSGQTVHNLDFRTEVSKSIPKVSKRHIMSLNQYIGSRNS